jgi:hypothetical protein
MLLGNVLGVCVLIFSLQQVHEVQMAQDLPPDIPKKDPIPMNASVPPPKDVEATDEEEEWYIEPDSSSITTMIKQVVSSPTATLSAAADVVTDKTTAAAQTIKENTQHTYTLLDEGEWHGRSPAEYVAMVCSFLAEIYAHLTLFRNGLFLTCQDLIARPINSHSVVCRGRLLGECFATLLINRLISRADCT